MKKYTLKLNDGTTVSNLTVNGNNLVSPVKVDESVFADNLETVTVSDGESETKYYDLELVAIQEHPDGWYIALRQLTQNELILKELKKKVESAATYDELSEAIREGVNSYGQ